MPLDLPLGPSAAGKSVLSDFLEQIPAGIVVFDHEGRSLLHNTVFTEIVGGVPLLVQDLPLESDLVTRALDGNGNVVVGEDVLLRPAVGQQRQVRVSVLPVRSSGEASRGILIIVANASAELDGDAKAILGVVGHDLRNPLAAMR